jgi:mRNA-degrading endonuclease toxin of MazEF toxin-antitoxin module
MTVKNHMKKFDEWNTLKKIINDRGFEVRAHERELWWASVGINVGSEQDGRGDDFERPVLVAKKLSTNVLYAFPISSQCKNIEMHMFIDHEKIHGYVLLDQLKAIDRKRLVRKVGVVDKILFASIVERFKSLF